MSCPDIKMICTEPHVWMQGKISKIAKALIVLCHYAPVNILPARGGAAGIHGALDRRPFLTGGNLINLWNPGPG